MNRQLYDAVKGEDEGSVRNLLKKATAAEVNYKDEAGRSALMVACLSGASKFVKMLLAHKDIDPNLQCTLGCTALMEACEKGHTVVVKMVLAHPCLLVSLSSRDRATPLMKAARGGHAKIVEVLLAHKDIAVNARDKANETALMKAACNGHIAIVESLLSFPTIETHHKNKEGKTALDLASKPKISSLLQAHATASATVNAAAAAASTAVVASFAAASVTAATKLTNKRKRTTDTADADPVPATAASSHPSTALASAPSNTPDGWLATRLLASGFDAQAAHDCEQKLVVQEGFMKESDFAECPPAIFNHAYLTSIGVNGMGLQRLLLKLHGELHAAIPTRGANDNTESIAPAGVAAAGVKTETVQGVQEQWAAKVRQMNAYRYGINRSWP